jgi:hypothetical protein
LTGSNSVARFKLSKMNKELNLQRESSLYDSNFEVSFDLKGYEKEGLLCTSWITYDIDGCYLVGHEFTINDQAFNIDENTKQELIKAIDKYFSREFASEYLDKYEVDCYEYNDQLKEEYFLGN